MTPRKVFVSTTSFCERSRAPIELLKENRFEVIINPLKRKMTPGELAGHATGCAGLIAGTEKISAETLKEVSTIKVISRCGSGMDNIDLEYAERAGIKVLRTVDVSTNAVAELTLGLALCLLRNVSQCHIDIKKGVWKKRMGVLLSGKKVGVIGFGAIGRRSAELYSAFGCHISFIDPAVDGDDRWEKKASLEDLLCWSDIIVIHASTSERLISSRELDLVNKGSWIINVARGGIIDEAALYDKLYSGHLAGAALDVFETEPYQGPLAELDNVIVTPHIGSYAAEARIAMETQAARNLIEGFRDIAGNRD